MLVNDLLERRLLFTGVKIVRNVRNVLYIFRHGVDDEKWDDRQNDGEWLASASIAAQGSDEAPI
jgi:hypothetical protein